MDGIIHLQPCSLLLFLVPRNAVCLCSLCPTDLAGLTPIMPGPLSLPTLGHFLLPWAFAILHEALGDAGKTSALPKIWGPVGERLQV